MTQSSRQMTTGLLVPTSFPVLVPLPPPEVTHVMSSFSNGPCVRLVTSLAGSGKAWQLIPDLSKKLHQQNLERRSSCRARPSVRPFSRSAGGREINDRPLVERQVHQLPSWFGESKLYITASSINTGTSSALQMGPWAAM